MNDRLVFAPEPPEEIPLDPPPLVKVLAQLRFPPVLEMPRLIPALQRRLQPTYPIFRPEHIVEATFGADGVSQNKTQAWRFLDLKQEWAIILTQSFVALETTNYHSRDDFIDRIQQLLKSINGPGKNKNNPVVVTDRLGIRYINRIVGEDATGGLQDLIRPEMYGPLTIEMPPEASLLASIGQLHLQLDGPQLQARWGRLPPNALMVADVEPVPDISWVLDIDVFEDRVTSFDPAEIAAAARRASAYAYHFFRWAMSQRFIESRRTS